MLKIQISDEAAAWYKDEMLLEEGGFVRFFARYGGCSTVQQGFSLGVSNDEPIDIGAETKKDGITFYIEEKDLWYFDGNDLIVEFNQKVGEPEFRFSK